MVYLTSRVASNDAALTLDFITTIRNKLLLEDRFWRPQNMSVGLSDSESGFTKATYRDKNDKITIRTLIL